MIGTRYWSTGIVVRWHEGDDKPWAVKLQFFDDGFCDSASTQGELTMRYLVADLSEAIDILRRDAERVGIEWKDPTIYMAGDGEWSDHDYPNGWRTLVDDQARRLGWRPTYGPLEEVAP